MNQPSTLRNSKFATRNSAFGFTLVELLVVISIIGLLAALVVGGASVAIINSRKARVQTELKALETAISQYKSHRGYYPPDNTNTTAGLPNTAMTSLYYELTGTVPTNVPNQGFVDVNRNFLPTSDLQALFGVGGILNSSADPSQPAENFVGTMGMTVRTGTYNIPADTSHNYTLFGIAVPPGSPKALGTFVSGVQVNPWNYVVTNPTNNSAEFDLWMDVEWHGKTNRISNWSKDPVPLN